MDILNNLDSVLTRVYFHHKNKPEKSESKFQKNIAERTNLRKEIFDEIAKQNKNIERELFKRYFDYSNPSDMYKALSEAKSLEKIRL